MTWVRRYCTFIANTNKKIFNNIDRNIFSITKDITLQDFARYYKNIEHNSTIEIKLSINLMAENTALDITMICNIICCIFML